MFTVDAVLFDFDGTLVTLQINFPLMRRRVNETIIAFGVPSHRLTASFSWERIEQAVAWLKQHDSRQAQGLEHAAKAIVTQMEDEAAQIASPPPDVLPTLLALKASDIKIGLVTRNSMNAVQTVFKRHPLPFDVIVTRDHVRFLKPNPAHLLFTLSQLGIGSLDIAHCAFVGDHPSDIQVALRLGIVPVGLAHDEQSEKALRQAGAFVIIHRISELTHWLTNW